MKLKKNFFLSLEFLGWAGIIPFVISAFLLLNLLVGAIINNYQILMLENHENKKNEKNENK